MHHRSIARTYLNWFGNEAEQFSAEGTTLYAAGTDFVERYRHCQTGATMNAMDFVRGLAASRLERADAYAVIDAAEKLLRSGAL